MTELKSERDDGVTWLAESAASQFDTDILGDPTNDTAHSRVDLLLNDASNARISMMHIITTGTPDEAYRMAPHFVAVSALYNAMLRFNGYDIQAVINAHLEESVAIDYLLVGARDAGCSIASGINTSFGSKIFQNKYINQPYYCSVVWQVRLAALTASVERLPCNASNRRATIRSAECPPTILTALRRREPKNSASRRRARVRSGPSRTTSLRLSFVPIWTAYSANLVDGTSRIRWRCSGTDLSLFAWSELCNGDCVVSDIVNHPSAIASQSSTASIGDISGDAGHAIDGNTDGNFWDGSNTHTNSEMGWWQVDLGFEATIGRVDIWNRSDCCADRLKNINILLSNDGVNWIGAGDVTGILGYPSEAVIKQNDPLSEDCAFGNRLSLARRGFRSSRSVSRTQTWAGATWPCRWSQPR